MICNRIPYDIFMETIPNEGNSRIVKILIDDTNIEIWLYFVYLVISKKVPYVHNNQPTDCSE